MVRNRRFQRFIDLFDLPEPIAIDPRTATTPIVDTFACDTFEYASGGQGFRGVVDWNFKYRELPRRYEDKLFKEKPRPQPIMLGCAFAIRRDFFFDLGGYDEELLIWNGENYELSFKLWLCGGKLLQIPCSRVAHTFRIHNRDRVLPGIDFVAHNFKRIAEVWLDDYKDLLYRGDPEKYARIDAGDLTRPMLIRKTCKPFSFFLESIAPDMVERYPLVDPGVFGHGVIQSELDPSLCVDALGKKGLKPLDMRKCDKSLTNPVKNQDFILTWHRQIKRNDTYEFCLENLSESPVLSVSFKISTNLNKTQQFSEIYV